MRAPRNLLQRGPLASDADLGYARPVGPDTADAATLTAIRNAWDDSAIVDAVGHVWLRTERLHVVLRTSKGRTRKFLERMAEHDLVEVDGLEYIRGWVVAARLDQDLQRGVRFTRGDYLRFSEEHYRGVRDDVVSCMLRARYRESLEGLSRKLKRARIRTLGLTNDELTDQPLAQRGTHFAHILARSEFPEFMDCVWNGVVVNVDTHERMTLAELLDDGDLLSFCTRHGYSTAWHPPFAEALAGASR